MNNNDRSITAGKSNIFGDGSTSSKTADIIRTEKVASSTTITNNNNNNNSSQAPRAKIRPHKQGAAVVAGEKRRDSSSSGSSGPPENDASSQAFDAVKAADLFLSARIDKPPNAGGPPHPPNISDDVDTRQFCMGYREVVKFIDQLGVAFSFIGKMMRGRLDNIEALVHSDNREVAERYRTVDRLLQFDASQGVKKSRKDCGTKELLHLNRSLDFMAEFTDKAFKLNDEDKLSGVAVETYNATMAKYHPFLVRKTIQLALWTLPTKKQMADLLGDIPYEKKMGQVAAMVEQQRAVYHTVDKLYTKHDLQSLA